MRKSLSALIGRMVDTTPGNGPLSGMDVSRQFRPLETTDPDVARNLNAAFWILLMGPDHPLHEPAARYLKALRRDGGWATAAVYFAEGAERIPAELTRACRSDPDLGKALEAAARWCGRSGTDWDDDARKKIWGLFFPEGVECLGNPDAETARIRERRQVRVTRPNPEPIQDPAREILFMSNVLVTTPQDGADLDGLPCGTEFIEALKPIVREEQVYWYDHPIQIGVGNENNEAVYGLRGLNDAVAFEKARGGVRPDDAVTCLLSVSVTHQGLHAIVKDYLKAVYLSVDPFPHLNIFLFSEVDAGRIVEEVLVPAADRYLKDRDAGLLTRVFGVDGEYGRHYSFLKALSAYWQVFIDPGVKGSFKLDLDQVFDQEILVSETGMSALEHFRSPLWGADGVDAEGRGIQLGMMAGALVNAADIHQGLFTPDVPMPDPIPGGEAVVFFSQLPQAISTRAEMMAQYTSGMPDGEKTCLQRVHVTGGTCAALVQSIRRHRPFTPAWIGRAEDQAYLLSCLFKDPEKNLRYLHKPGLTMRHDKSLFAGQAIEGAKTGKYVGDLVRTLLFSYYAEALPWSRERIKRAIDPFTGCFASRIPITLVYLRLGLRLLACFAKGSREEEREGLKLTKLAVERVDALIRMLDKTPNPLIARYEEEKQGWDIFYDVLDRIEERQALGDAFAMSLGQKARELVNRCRIQSGR